MADPFEEFEFKPLTEGLGFHKKAANLGATPSAAPIAPRATPTASSATATTAPRSFEIKPSEARAPETKSASQSISELMASLPPSLDFLDEKQDLARAATTSSSAMPSAPATSAPSFTVDRPQIFQPLTGPTVGSVLPAPGTKAGSLISQASAMTPGSLATATVAAPLAHTERMAQGFAKAFPRTEKTKTKTIEGLQPVAANFAAGLIDAMVVAGVSTILLVCLITITRVNLIALLTNASTDLATQGNLALLFVAVLQMYMLVSRAFFGASLGEWAFELQLGSNDQQKTLAYPFQVLLRTLVTTATGFFALPLLSFAFNRDLSRYLTGLQLYRRV